MRATRTRPVKPTQQSRRMTAFLQEVKHIASQVDNKQFAAMYESAVAQAVAGDMTLFNFMSRLERAPVGIEEFLDSTEFLGATDLVIWPEVRRAIIDINRNWWRGPEHAYREAILMGATGTGKSTIIIVSILYHLYLLSCINKPQLLYGLSSATSIVFPIMGAKPNVVNKVIYAPMRKLLESMPYFQQHMMPNKLIDSEMYFEEKNVRVVKAGGDEDAILGEAVIGGCIDEINFMSVVLRSKKAEVTSGRAGLYDQAEQTHNRMVSRKKGRFTYPGPMIGIVFPSSSTRYRGDFTDKRKAFIEKEGITTTYIYNKRQYEVTPASRYSGETFRLLIGNDISHDTRVLRDDEEVVEGSWVEEVPIEYLEDFKNKPHEALRDVMGISHNAMSPFIKSRFKVFECVEFGKEKGIESFLVNDHVVLGVDGMPQVKLHHYCHNPSRPRYVHIDLSRNGDRCVAAGSRVLMGDWSTRAIEYVRPGDTVVTHTGRLKEVVEVHNNGSRQVLEISRYGWPEPLRATGNHMVWAVRRSAVSHADGRLIKPDDRMFSGRSSKAARARYNYLPEFVRLDSLRPGDFLVSPRPRQTEVFNLAGAELTYETGYIAGLFAAEGSFYTHRSKEYAQFSLHANEVRIASQLKDYLESSFGVSLRPIKDSRSNGVTYRITRHSQLLVDFLLTAIGELSARKHMRVAYLATDREFAAGLAHGYVDGDGYVQYGEDGRASRFKVKTISRTMADSFYWLLSTWGYLPVLDKSDGYTDSRGVYHQTCYAVSLAGVAQMRKFETWGKGECNVPCSRALGLPDYALYPITEVVAGGVSAVYDLTVVDDSSYVVGNSAVHNCGVAMLRFDGLVQVTRRDGADLLPSATVEMACTIEPDANNEIDIAEVRAFVRSLKTKYGYPIKAVTYDGFDSRESIQAWRKDGMPAKEVSVDKTSTPYKQFRDAMYDRRIALLDDPDLLSEILELEYDENKDKVDHSVIGKKDLSDAVCAAYTSLCERRSTWHGTVDDVNDAMAGRADDGERSDGGRR